jgi:hypothetical protein
MLAVLRAADIGLTSEHGCGDAGQALGAVRVATVIVAIFLAAAFSLLLQRAAGRQKSEGEGGGHEE